MLSIRQQIDKINHDMMNALTQQIETIFTPMINNTNQIHEMLAGQMDRIADFFGTPPVPPRPTPQASNIRLVETPGNGARPENQRQVPDRDEEERIDQNILRMVQHHQNVDQVLRNVQQNPLIGHDNISNVVEQILVQNGLNIGLLRPNFLSPISEYVRKTKLPRGWKVLNFTKFAGKTGESTIEHVARFQSKAGDLSNNENLKSEIFPKFFNKECFYLVYHLASTIPAFLDPIGKTIP
ncbi:uncharacterized protein LOC131658588 [Vicia villosa]|uniref:uncharacterized protein LOC131658588 n=1 Tax=Vicia villosa TaxID=3911 RepID=UPI00273CEFD3|nr:uncharacterized protein LOC131658588 [Vicia villosa]